MNVWIALNRLSVCATTCRKVDCRVLVYRDSVWASRTKGHLGVAISKSCA